MLAFHGLLLAQLYVQSGRTVEKVVRSLDYVLYAKSLQSCPTLTLLSVGSCVHGILQTRVLEWVAIASSWGSSLPGIEPASLMFSCIVRRVLYH